MSRLKKAKMNTSELSSKVNRLTSLHFAIRIVGVVGVRIAVVIVFVVVIVVNAVAAAVLVPRNFRITPARPSKDFHHGKYLYE